MKSLTKTILTAALFAAMPFSVALAQSMTGAERQELIANFLQADTNNDGALYRSEFELLMKLNAEDNLGRAAMVVRTGAYEKAFTRLDKNSDGAISREEIQAFAEERG
jgi:Ca2+-binding EF-hand superfamily protein